MFWPLNVDPSDAVVGVLMVVGFERWLAFQKLEAEDTKGPKVDFFVVVFTCKHGKPENVSTSLPDA